MPGDWWKRFRRKLERRGRGLRDFVEIRRAIESPAVGVVALMGRSTALTSGLPEQNWLLLLISRDSVELAVPRKILPWGH